ncbi:uncharacterized protein LOC34620351 [Cyclospora cayetanensis]|uniref:Uncharacterized protein LOC34620351 n=1 Tax=Cyclospora cayetanensis TaxID=88456 RepID=A0A6P6RQD6_9EIME|nr:uncharacterized protein LOC34620351 [Cyclospora cayetanensis]
MLQGPYASFALAFYGIPSTSAATAAAAIDSDACSSRRPLECPAEATPPAAAGGSLHILSCGCAHKMERQLAATCCDGNSGLEPPTLTEQLYLHPLIRSMLNLLNAASAQADAGALGPLDVAMTVEAAASSGVCALEFLQRVAETAASLAAAGRLSTKELLWISSGFARLGFAAARPWEGASSLASAASFLVAASRLSSCHDTASRQLLELAAAAVRAWPTTLQQQQQQQQQQQLMTDPGSPFSATELSAHPFRVYLQLVVALVRYPLIHITTTTVDAGALLSDVNAPTLVSFAHSTACFAATASLIHLGNKELLDIPRFLGTLEANIEACNCSDWAELHHLAALLEIQQHPQWLSLAASAAGRLHRQLLQQKQQHQRPESGRSAPLTGDRLDAEDFLESLRLRYGSPTSWGRLPSTRS